MSETPDYLELSAAEPGQQPTDELTALTVGETLEDTVPKDIFYDSPSQEGSTVDLTDRVDPQGPAVASDFPTITLPSKEVSEAKKRAKHIEQVKESNKVPDSFATNQGVVPDPGQAEPTDVLVAGHKENRRAIIITNTGSASMLIAQRRNIAQTNGKLIAAGGVLTLYMKAAVFANVPIGGSSTTFDVIETFYDTSDPVA